MTAAARVALCAMTGFLIACAPTFSRPPLAPDAVLGELPGVRSVEGHPDAGLPYRLRLPLAAAPERPARLVVWLHPTGTSANAWVESLAPELAARGFALLVLTHPQDGGWDGDAVNRLMLHTLPEVARLPGVDARRPVLLGFSAGGQIALLLWKQRPQNFAGLALDGAAPYDVRAGGFVPLEPPAHPAVREVPLLVFVGEREEAASAWRARAPAFRALGVPLTVREVAGAAHQWLLLGAERDVFLSWIAALRP